MKTQIILLALGVIGVIANPVSKQTTADDNKNPPQLENIESQTKRDESTLNNGDEQKENNVPEPAAVRDDKVDIIIEESVLSTIDPLTDVDDPIPFDFPPEPIQDDRVPSRPIDAPNQFDFAIRPIDISPSAVDISPNLVGDAPFDMDISAQIPGTFQDDLPLNQMPFRDGNLNTFQDEIMETAAGFVPTPLVFRRRQKPRRRFATRRHFRPNPFRRKFQFFYPYYGFYHPSSLRFY